MTYDLRLNPSPPHVSVIVPAYNAAATIVDCLHALAGQITSHSYEVIVVDDGSTDYTARIISDLQSTGYDLRLVTQPHAGAAAARNRGAVEAQGNLLLFTDADCEPTSVWIETLVSALERADGAKGTYRTRQRSLVARWVQAEYESKYRRMAQRPNIDFIDTYSAAYRRDVFESAGGFNESLEVDEDQELSFRLVEGGARLVFVPEAVVYHRHVATARAYIKRKFRIGYWKVLVAALHPARIFSDSHTPQSLKAQMALLALLLLTLPAAPFSHLARCVAAGSAATLFASALPITFSIARHDPEVALVAPVMSLLRAAGLLTGTVVGLARFGPRLLRRTLSTSTQGSRIKYNRSHD
jgi:cellulose synthase/poly-beta-1,6-N-acetylglucosamine synthase-like glycosyltransferase